MCITIKPTDQGTYLISGKEVYEDMNGNFICKNQEGLTQEEKMAWSSYYNAIINSDEKLLLLNIKNLEIKIDAVKSQLHIANTKENSSQKQQLITYYQNKIKSYELRKDKLIKRLPVSAEELNELDKITSTAN